MFGSLILRSLSTGPALAEVVVMGGGLMGTGIAQVCIPQYWAVWSAKILKTTIQLIFWTGVPIFGVQVTVKQCQCLNR